VTESTPAVAIREALDALYPAEDVKEVCLLDGPSVGYFDDRDALVRAVLPHDAYSGDPEQRVRPIVNTQSAGS
jgi:hypothetical protein